MKPKGLLFALVTLGLLTSARPTQGQTLTLFRQLPTVGGSPLAAADASGIYLGATVVTGNIGEGMVRKYNLEGAEAWSRRLGSRAYPRSITAGAGGVYIAGVVEEGLPGQAQTALREVFVRLYSTEGNEIWTRQIGFESGTAYNATSIAADASGVYVCYGADREGVLLRRFDPSGAELWTKQIGGSIGYLAADNTGVYFSPGFGFVRKYDGARGSEMWTRTITSGVSGLAAGASGVYVQGYLSLLRFDSSGNRIWDAPGIGGASALVADRDGVYVAGALYNAAPGQCASGASDTLVERYDAAGRLMWSRQFGSYLDEWPLTMTVDENSVAVAGASFLARLERNSERPSPNQTRIHHECVLNAASYVGGAVSPGDLVTIFGTVIGPGQPVAARIAENRPFETTLAETRVLFDGVPAPLLYASSGQTTAIVPQAVARMSAVGVQVEYRGTLSNTVRLPVVRAHPGIFSLDASGVGQAAVVNEDGTLNSRSNPARRGSVVAIFGTGGGATDPAADDGQIAGNPPPRLRTPVTVTIDVDRVCGNCDCGIEERAEPLYGGAVTGFAGLIQVNVRIPESVPEGYWFLKLAVERDGASSPRSVRIAVR